MLQIVQPLPALPSAPAKQRILHTADALFYDEGIRSVGVDRLISESSVTKATFYKHFGSKDRVITAYLDFRHRTVAERMGEIAGATDDPEQAIRGIVADLIGTIQASGFRGCPFVNAAAEFSDPDHPVRAAVREHRDWYEAAIGDLFRALGHPLAGDAADEFVLARDGALSGGYAGDPIAATGALGRAVDPIIAVAHA
jgi:AcrR family transcriptional regulator